MWLSSGDATFLSHFHRALKWARNEHKKMGRGGQELPFPRDRYEELPLPGKRFGEGLFPRTTCTGMVFLDMGK